MIRSRWKSKRFRGCKQIRLLEETLNNIPLSNNDEQRGGDFVQLNVIIQIVSHKV